MYKIKFGTFFTTCQLCFTSISLHSWYSEIQVECANAGYNNISVAQTDKILGLSHLAR